MLINIANYTVMSTYYIEILDGTEANKEPKTKFRKILTYRILHISTHYVTTFVYVRF